jgi:hypothetical protein
LITFADITLRNITTSNNWFPAGVIRCNSTNPCKNFVFDNVNVRSPLWDTLGIGYITEFAEGIATNSHPDPGFKPVGYYDDPKNRNEELEAFALDKFFSAEFMMSKLFKIAFAADTILKQA